MNEKEIGNQDNAGIWVEVNTKQIVKQVDLNCSKEVEQTDVEVFNKMPSEPIVDQDQKEKRKRIIATILKLSNPGRDQQKRNQQLFKEGFQKSGIRFFILVVIFSLLIQSKLNFLLKKV